MARAMALDRQRRQGSASASASSNFLTWTGASGCWMRTAGAGCCSVARPSADGWGNRRGDRPVAAGRPSGKRTEATLRKRSLEGRRGARRGFTPPTCARCSSPTEPSDNRALHERHYNIYSAHGRDTADRRDLPRLNRRGPPDLAISTSASTRGIRAGGATSTRQFGLWNDRVDDKHVGCGADGKHLIARRMKRVTPAPTPTRLRPKAPEPCHRPILFRPGQQQDQAKVTSPAGT